MNMCGYGAHYDDALIPYQLELEAASLRRYTVIRTDAQPGLPVRQKALIDCSQVKYNAYKMFTGSMEVHETKYIYLTTYMVQLPSQIKES